MICLQRRNDENYWYQPNLDLFIPIFWSIVLISDTLILLFTILLLCSFAFSFWFYSILLMRFCISSSSLRVFISDTREPKDSFSFFFDNNLNLSSLFWFLIICSWKLSLILSIFSSSKDTVKCLSKSSCSYFSLSSCSSLPLLS